MLEEKEVTGKENTKRATVKALTEIITDIKTKKFDGDLVITFIDGERINSFVAEIATQPLTKINLFVIMLKMMGVPVNQLPLLGVDEEEEQYPDMAYPKHFWMG